MNLLQDVLTYIRRIIKSPSNSQITDNLLIDYVNRFWLMDVDARLQLFDLKTKYQFQTTPGIDQYNMPLYNIQTEPGAQTIASFPVYQGFLSPVRVNGITAQFYSQESVYYDLWPKYVQSLQNFATGNGGATYTFNIPFFPMLPGHVDMAGIIATGNNVDPIFATTINTAIPYTSIYPSVYFTAIGPSGQNIVVQDSGQFLSGNTTSQLFGLLMTNGTAPFGYSALTGGYSTTSNTINYNTGVANVTFPQNIPTGNAINIEVYTIQQGIPRSILYFNNTISLRPPPNTQYLVELNAYLTPAAFLTSGQALPFAYMAEYIARGAARKILADTGDVELFRFHEIFFKEQESLVWKRSQRQFTATRTDTIYSTSGFQFTYNQSSIGT